MKIIAGSSHYHLTRSLATNLGFDLVKYRNHQFKDGEIYIEIMEDLHQQDVIIVQSTAKAVNDKLIELLFLMNTVKHHKARKITVLIPYLGYGRHDKAKLGNVTPIALIADIFTTLGLSRLITIDIHSPLLENFFRVPTQIISFESLFVSQIDIFQNPVIIAADQGSIARATKISNMLRCDLAIINKLRDEFNICKINNISGMEVDNRHCIIVDDIIDTGNTICKVADFLASRGALSIVAYVTHAVLSAGAMSRVQSSKIQTINISNSIVHKNLPSKFQVTEIEPSIRKVLTPKII